MAICTKSGDTGETGLFGGRRVKKTSGRIAAIGEIDELNAALGVLRSQKIRKSADRLLEKIQNELFCAGAELARDISAPQEKAGRTNRLALAVPHSPSISAEQVVALEKAMDALETDLPPLKNFILPAGTPFAAHAHLARAVCRRAERALWKLAERESVNPELLKYMNRLSDLLFLVARRGTKDVYWNL